MLHNTDVNTLLIVITMSIEVILDNYTGECYPGQTVAGRLDCYLNKEKNLRAIRIKFKGLAETEWYESESYYDHSTKRNKSRRVRYSAEEVYFDQEYILVQGGENFSLPAGKHSYPFSYILPAQLPSSFEGVHGNIRYTIKGVIDRPWKFDYESKIQLNLCSPLDLNYVPGLRDPLATSVDKHLCCWWCKSGPLTFDASLPVSGYCPGQEVTIGAYVQNMSNVSAENVKFKIYKNFEYISHYPSTHHRNETYVIAEIVEGGIGAHGEKSWTSNLLIPANDIYPNLLPCSIIKVSYALRGKVVMPCPHSNLHTEFPIMVGSVPLSGVQPAPLGPPPTELPLPTYNSVLGFQPVPYPPAPISGEASAPLLQYPESSKYSQNHQPSYPSSSGDVKLTPDGLPFPLNSSAPPSSAVPYPPPVGTLYSNGNAPYPSSGIAPYPPATSYSAEVSAPYPTPGAPYLSAAAPYPSGGLPYSDATAPPSYDESKKLNEKSEKQ